MTGGPLESVSDNNREFKAIRGERRSRQAATDPTARQLTACYFRQQAAGGQSPREAGEGVLGGLEGGVMRRVVVWGCGGLSTVPRLFLYMFCAVVTAPVLILGEALLRPSVIFSCT